MTIGLDLTFPCRYPPQKPQANGYVQVRVGPRSQGRREYAHRIAYRAAYGQIPDGCEVDHACHDSMTCRLGNGCPHRACDEPAHLVATSHTANVGRGGNRGVQVMAERRRARTTCPQGHPYDGRNTERARTCSTCRREATRRYRERNRSS